jgi:hypothetical protein
VISVAEEVMVVAAAGMRTVVVAMDAVEGAVAAGIDRRRSIVEERLGPGCSAKLLPWRCSRSATAM